MLEEVFEDAGADSRLLDVADVVGVLLGDGDDFVQTLFNDVSSVGKK